MVGHLVHVDRATPLALRSLPMASGRLSPWLDPATQLISVLVLAAVVVSSAAARNKSSADNINKPAFSRQKVFAITSSFLRYFTAATLLIFIYRLIPVALASFWSAPATPLTVPPSTTDRILNLIRPLMQHIGLLRAQIQPIRPPAPLASTSLMSMTLKLMPWFTAEKYFVTLLNTSMAMTMVWKILMAAISSRAVTLPSSRLLFHGLLFTAGGITLAITQHIDTHLSRATIELIEQSVGSTNAILALDLVTSLPALVLSQDSRLSIPTLLVAQFGLRNLDTLTVYAANISGCKRFISPTHCFVFPTLHQKNAFTHVVVLFALLQLIQITTTSLVILISAVSGSAKHPCFALPSSHREREEESELATLLGYQFTQALLMDVMPGDAPFAVQHSSWWSKTFGLFTNSQSLISESAFKPVSETDVTTMLARIQELEAAQDQLQGKVNGLQAAKASLVEKLRSARRKARLNESAMLRWKALAECYEQAASMEATVHEEVGTAAVQSTTSEPTVKDSKDKTLGCCDADLVNSGDVEVLRCLLRDIKSDTGLLRDWLDEEPTAPAGPELNTLPADIAPILQLRTLSQGCTSARAEFIEVVTRVREQEKARRTQLSDELYQQKRSSWSLELASLDLKDNEDALREELYEKESECDKLKSINKGLQEENNWWTSVDSLRVDLFRLGRNFLGDRKRGPPTPTSRADPEPAKLRPSHPKNRARARSSAPLVPSNRHDSVALGAL